MLENLIKLVREHAGEAIIANPAIPNEKNEDAIAETSDGIARALKAQMSGGNMDQLSALFNNGNSVTGNPIVGNIIQSVAGNLMQKFGISSAQAGSLASSLIPNVMNSLVEKTNDPNDNTFTMDGILGSLTDGKSSIGNMLGGLFGGK